MTDNSPTDSAFDASAESRQSSVRMDVHGMTHVGRKRATNEDQFLIADLKKSLRIHQTSLGLDHQTRLFGGSQGKLLLVADGMDAPAIGDSPSNMESSRWSNTLWNVLGGDSDDLAPDVYRANLQIGDVLLLCTDGLTKHVPDDRIKEHLDKGEPAQSTCQRLVDEANENGGTDNITGIVARFREKFSELEAEEAETATQLDKPGDHPSEIKPPVALETAGIPD